MNKTLIGARWGLLLIMAISALWFVASGVMLWQQKQINNFIADPTAYDEVPENPRAQFAQASQFESEQEHNLALEQLTLVLGSKDTALIAEAYYNRANINLREAMTMTDSDARQIPLIELAKQDYRSALNVKPGFWDARYNLEVALTVVPEDPALDGDSDKRIISSRRSIESKAFKIDLP